MSRYSLHPSTVSDLAELKRAYLAARTAPLDGMWQTFADMADHHAIYKDDSRVGYVAVNGDGILLQCHLTADHEARPAFEAVLRALEPKGACLASGETEALALCMDHQASVAVNAILYEIVKTKNIVPANFLASQEMRQATDAHLDEAVAFAAETLGADAGWLRGYYSGLTEKGALFGLWQQGQLIATGERRKSEWQPAYADVGMVVGADHRRKGLATNILRYLIGLCQREGLAPVCSTERDNVAAQNAIEKAGFTSRQRMLEITFPDTA